MYEPQSPTLDTEAKIGPIRVAKNWLGKDNETYRAALERVACVQSAKDLNEETEACRKKWKPTFRKIEKRRHE